MLACQVNRSHSANAQLSLNLILIVEKRADEVIGFRYGDGLSTIGASVRIQRILSFAYGTNNNGTFHRTAISNAVKSGIKLFFKIIGQETTAIKPESRPQKTWP